MEPIRRKRTWKRKPISAAREFQSYIDRTLLNDAYVAYAKAMESAQTLEGVITLLLLGLFYDRSSAENLQECEKLQGNLFKSSLGRLLERLKKVHPAQPGFERELTKALDLRNFLAHHYFTKYLIQWLYPNGLRRRIKDLKAMKRKSDRAGEQIVRLHEAVCRKIKRDEQNVFHEFETKLLPLIVKSIVHDPSFRRAKRKKLKKTSSGSPRL